MISLHWLEMITALTELGNASEGERWGGGKKTQSDEKTEREKAGALEEKGESRGVCGESEKQLGRGGDRSGERRQMKS